MPTLNYLYNKRKNQFYCLLTFVIVNFYAAMTYNYAFNLLSVLISPYWYVFIIFFKNKDDSK